jgi:hypothetical protein
MKLWVNDMCARYPLLVVLVAVLPPTSLMLAAMPSNNQVLGMSAIVYMIGTGFVFLWARDAS